MTYRSNVLGLAISMNHEVHAFIFGFVRSVLIQPAIMLHSSQTSQMLPHAGNHSRDARNRFEYYCAVAVSLRKKSICYESESKSNPQSYPV